MKLHTLRNATNSIADDDTTNRPVLVVVSVGGWEPFKSEAAALQQVLTHGCAAARPELVGDIQHSMEILDLIRAMQRKHKVVGVLFGDTLFRFSLKAVHPSIRDEEIEAIASTLTEMTRTNLEAAARVSAKLEAHPQILSPNDIDKTELYAQEILRLCALAKAQRGDAKVSIDFRTGVDFGAIQKVISSRGNPLALRIQPSNYRMDDLLAAALEDRVCRLQEEFAVPMVAYHEMSSDPEAWRLLTQYCDAGGQSRRIDVGGRQIPYFHTSDLMTDPQFFVCRRIIDDFFYQKVAPACLESSSQYAGIAKAVAFDFLSRQRLLTKEQIRASFPISLEHVLSEDAVYLQLAMRGLVFDAYRGAETPTLVFLTRSPAHKLPVEMRALTTRTNYGLKRWSSPDRLVRMHKPALSELHA